MLDRDSQSVLRASLPLFVSLGLFGAITLVDIVLAGMLGAAAQAALGIADQIIFLNMLVMNGFCAGVSTRISQACGAGQGALCRRYIRHSLIAALGFGILASVLGYVSADAVASLFAREHEVRRQACEFIRLCALGHLPWALVACQGAILRASGRLAPGMVQWLLVAIVCIGLELICFFGVPGMRSLVPLALCWDVAIAAGALAGVPMVTAAAALVGMPTVTTTAALVGMPTVATATALAGLPITTTAGGKSHFFWRRISLSLFICDQAFLNDLRSILAVGLPVMVGEICWLASGLLLFAFLSFLPQATTSQAAWTIHLKVEETAAGLPLLACSQATAAAVGRRTGAGDRVGAWRIAAAMALAAALVFAAAGIVVAGAAPYMVQCFSADAEVRLMACRLLQFSPLAYAASAALLVLSAAMEGAGETLMPMAVNIATIVLARLPLAWFFAMYFAGGLVGVCWAKCLSSLIGLWGMACIFKRQAPEFGAISHSRRPANFFKLPSGFKLASSKVDVMLSQDARETMEALWGSGKD